MTCSICNDVHSVFSSNNKRIEPCPQCSAVAKQKPEPARLTPQQWMYKFGIDLSAAKEATVCRVMQEYSAQETAEKDKEIARLTKLIQEAEQYFGQTFR